MVARHLAHSVLAAVADTRVVFLNGARQTGKSTLAKWLTTNGFPARYLTMDDAGVLSAATHDPGAFLAGLTGPVILDEVQRAPGLFLAIKAEVDRDPRPGRFLLTGSANVLLLPQVSDMLAGRMEIITLWPFSRGEIAGTREDFVDRVFAGRSLVAEGSRLDKQQTLTVVLEGGYPAVVTRPSPERRGAWFGSYLTAVLQRDVRDLANIEGLVELPRLLTLLAARSASLLNFSAVARDAALPQTTLKRYMALLETAFLVHRAPAWSANIGKRLVKAPKLSLNDTGLMAYLLGINQQRLDAEPMLAGPLLENFVFAELSKQVAWSQVRPKLFHYRTLTGQEVDLVLEDASGSVVGVEVKAALSVQTADFKDLRAFAEAAGNRFRRGVILYLGKEPIAFGSQMYALPVSTLWEPAQR